MKTSLGAKNVNKNICISPRSKFISSFDKDFVIFYHSRFFDAICSCRKFSNYFTITFITCQPVLTRKIVTFTRNRIRDENLNANITSYLPHLYLRSPVQTFVEMPARKWPRTIMPNSYFIKCFKILRNIQCETIGLTRFKIIGFIVKRYFF